MKKGLFFVFFILLINVAIAEEVEDYNSNSYLDIEFNLYSILPASYQNDAKLSYMNAELYLIPKDSYMYEILNIAYYSEPSSLVNKNSNSVLFSWNNLAKTYKYGLNANIKSKNVINKIPRVDFPIRGVDQDIKIYLEPEKISDINEDIIKKTNDLVEGETDLFEASFKIAEWVNTNIRYDLNTLTESASQKSSWVYANKYGVCDEITSLFISMTRSAGIPSRFVTGMVYSNANYDFGNHGWAELYFPGYGWVPFDVTFGQYGWIDPSHIKLSDSLDAGEASVKYSWKSFGLDIGEGSLSLNSNIINVGGKINYPYTLEIIPLINEVGPGSYVPLMVNVFNNNNYYASDSVIITKALDLTEKNNKEVLLKPNSYGQAFWIMKIPNSLDKRFSYKVEVAANDLFGYNADAEVSYSSNYNVVSLDEANKLIAENSMNLKEESLEKLNIDCSSDSTFYNLGETAEIQCLITSKVNQDLSNLEFCINEKCRSFDIISKDSFYLNGNISLDDINQSIVSVTVKNNEILVKSFVKLNIFEDGPMIINLLNYQEEVPYNSNIQLDIELKSFYYVKDIKINLNNKYFKEIKSLNDPQVIKFDINSKELYNNPIEINVNYIDNKNIAHNIKEEFNINVSNVPWYIKILSFLKII